MHGGGEDETERGMSAPVAAMVIEDGGGIAKNSESTGAEETMEVSADGGAARPSSMACRGSSGASGGGRRGRHGRGFQP